MYKENISSNSGGAIYISNITSDIIFRNQVFDSNQGKNGKTKKYIKIFN